MFSLATCDICHFCSANLIYTSHRKWHWPWVKLQNGADEWKCLEPAQVNLIQPSVNLWMHMSNRSVSQYCMTCSLSSIWCMNPPLKCSYAVTVQTVLFIRLFSFWHHGTKTTANKYAMRSYWDTVIVVATSVVSFCLDKLFEKKELLLHASINMPCFHHNLYCCRTFLHFPYI